MGNRISQSEHANIDGAVLWDRGVGIKIVSNLVGNKPPGGGS